jgi:hypothetical protein
MPSPFAGLPQAAAAASGLSRNAVLGAGAAVALVLVAFALLLVATSGPSGCSGGRNFLDPPTYSSSDNVHWTMTYTCNNGGQTSVSVPSSQVP